MSLDCPPHRALSYVVSAITVLLLAALILTTQTARTVVAPLVTAAERVAG